MTRPASKILTIHSRQTDNPKLAAALAAIGIPFDRKPLFKLSMTGATPDRWCWCFAPASECGKHKTDELIAAWSDPEWVNANPDHPFAYIKVAFQNHRFLLDLVKQGTTLGVVEYRGKYGLIPTHLAQKEADVYLARLEGKS